MELINLFQEVLNLAYLNKENRIASGFDIINLHHFQPARAHCQKCYALLKVIPRNKQQQIQCPVCQVRYAVQGDSEIDRFRSYFKRQGLYIEFDDIFKHSKQLGSIASNLEKYNPDYPPLRGLLEALNQAQQFVHFTTFGISHILLGALKMAAQRIQVRGIVSLSSDQLSMLPELESYKQEAPNLSIKAVCAVSPNWHKFPHQKLIIIDGLLAFKGSANLTLSGWRKAASGYEEVEIVTDIEKVISLNNRYFSPIWAELNNYGDTIAINHY